MIIQQGDSLYFEDKIPKDAVKKELPGGVVEHGESTHRHRLATNDYEYFETPKGERYLRLLKAVPLIHEEHERIDLKSGEYRVGRVREKGMFDDLIAPVID